MIVTLTANPSVDRAVAIELPLERGTVIRAGASFTEPGGKGINVARVLHAAGIATTALFPAAPGGPLPAACAELGLPFEVVPVAGGVRTNLTISEPDGTTTKINEPGETLSDTARANLEQRLHDLAGSADIVVLAGSLPPGVASSWYADLVRCLRQRGVTVVVDTSDRPLTDLATEFPAAAPDLIKPNADELAQLTGADPVELEHAAAAGDPAPVAQAGRTLIDRGVGTVLATLGAGGAVLVDAGQAWHAVPPPTIPRSTVGAGDSSLAGYLIGTVHGAPPAEALRLAVAYGTAAAGLPGTGLPAPADIRPGSVVVTRVRSPQ
ncbi:1-phosphofructokinase family hexose kinase [Skermania piniformis]|uniref:1-phosphofructokinase family hexose kinase n=1 Tax=Skermania pinensis TaxID=39122 RepID=A0ABX8S612_9ACTN|nr:1-phosphofructokinase family hexose kinase [Skermania piniformis]QXQ12424.1 1-phosphofructokinase family hexose kinase [Skermania piniformis]